MNPIYIAIPILLLMVLLWWIFIRPLFKYQKYASRNIRKDTFSKLIDIDKNILTISSAAIILTASFIKKEYLDVYLISSWISFLVSIISGVLLYIAFFTHNFTDEILMINYHTVLNKPQQKIPIVQEELDSIKSAEKNSKILLTSIFVLLYVEMTYLILALIYLTIFGFNKFVY